NLVDRFVEAVIEVHERIRGPKPAPEFLAGHQLAWSGQQHGEHLKRLLLKPDPDTALPQLASLKIGLEDAETNGARNGPALLHGRSPVGDAQSTTGTGSHRTNPVRRSPRKPCLVRQLLGEVDPTEQGWANH